MDKNLKGPTDNPTLQCYGPNCPTGKVRRFNGPSRYWRSVPPHYGYKGNNFFCSLQCGMDWAVLKCSAGSDPDT